MVEHALDLLQIRVFWVVLECYFLRDAHIIEFDIQKAGLWCALGICALDRVKKKNLKKKKNKKVIIIIVS